MSHTASRDLTAAQNLALKTFRVDDGFAACQFFDSNGLSKLSFLPWRAQVHFNDDREKSGEPYLKRLVHSEKLPLTKAGDSSILRCVSNLNQKKMLS